MAGLFGDLPGQLEVLPRQRGVHAQIFTKNGNPGKIEKAKSMKGPRMIISLAPCPTGWDFDPSLSADIGKLAVKTGVWPLKEYIDGKVVHTKPPHPRIPVEAYLEKQGRFRHLFEPERDEALLAQLQARVDKYWEGIE